MWAYDTCAVTRTPHFPIRHVFHAVEVNVMFSLPSYPAGFWSKKLAVCVFSAFDVVGGLLSHPFRLNISKIDSFRKD